MESYNRVVVELLKSSAFSCEDATICCFSVVENDIVLSSGHLVGQTEQFDLPGLTFLAFHEIMKFSEPCESQRCSVCRGTGSMLSLDGILRCLWID